MRVGHAPPAAAALRGEEIYYIRRRKCIMLASASSVCLLRPSSYNNLHGAPAGSSSDVGIIYYAGIASLPDDIIAQPLGSS